MRTCKDISDDLVRAKRRCETSFKLKEKSNIDGNVEFHPIFLATKTGRVLKITITPCYYHPYTGQALPIAWTKFHIDEGPLHGAMNRLVSPTAWNSISSIPYEMLYTNNNTPNDTLGTSMNAFYVLDSILVFLHDNYDGNIANKIIPYKKWWSNVSIDYSLCFTHDLQAFPNSSSVNLDVPFSHSHFRDIIMDDIEMYRHMLDMHALRNANKLSPEVRSALKTSKVIIPAEVNISKWVSAYVNHILNPVRDKIDKIMVHQFPDDSYDDSLSVYIKKEYIDKATELIDDIKCEDLMDEWSNTFEDRLITEKDLKLKDAKAKW